MAGIGEARLADRFQSAAADGWQDTNDIFADLGFGRLDHRDVLLTHIDWQLGVIKDARLAGDAFVGQRQQELDEIVDFKLCEE